MLLAAGEGKRLGTPKALVELGGRRLVDRGADLLREGGTAPVLVVTGAVPVSVPGVTLVPNPDWRTGMGSSLAAGLRALPGDCAAAVIALVDQPLIGPEVVRRLLAAHRAGAELAVAAYDGRARNPVLLARRHWAGVLAAAEGDAGARPYLRAHPGPRDAGRMRGHRPPRRRGHPGGPGQGRCPAGRAAVLARGSDPPEPPGGLRPGSFVTGPGPR